ncbi:MAG: hypothetical protein ACYC7B_05425 [Burkholderiales bacterium]
MRLGRRDIKKLALPVAVCLALVLAAAACAHFADGYLQETRQLATAAAAQRAEVQAKLASANQEELEIEASLQQYQALAARGIIGEENRLDWIDTVTAIKNERRLFNISYSIEPQKELDYPGFNPGGSVKFLVSRVKISIQLLHEGDLLNFIDDLARRGKPYLSVRSCNVAREDRSTGGTTLAPRLQAECVFDLITISSDKRA